MALQRGFTLVELIVVLAVAAILLTVGVPSFQEFLRNSRLVTHTNTFIGALHLARSEAIKRGVRVTLCKSADGLDCVENSQGYEQGWIVFVDPGNSGNKPRVDSGEVVLRVYPAVPASAGMSFIGNGSMVGYVSYTPDGRPKQVGGAFQAGTVRVCVAPKAREIVISRAGRVRVAQASC